MSGRGNQPGPPGGVVSRGRVGTNCMKRGEKGGSGRKWEGTLTGSLGHLDIEGEGVVGCGVDSSCMVC